jgi:L-fucose isomerase-like protein
MIKLKIKLLAYRDAPEAVFERAIERLERIISPENFELTDSQPDILFFLSGGSEQAALQQVSSGHFYLLVGSRHDNAYASAVEVKAHLVHQNIPSLLLDEEEADTKAVIQGLLQIKSGLKSLQGKRLGLIGQISEWLISSAVEPEVLQSKLGIKLIEIPWAELSHFSDYQPSATFLESFPDEKRFDLTETAKVSELLTDTILKKNLDALTVECFPMVQKDGVTACLPLARFNNEGIPAGCEGDITAIAGMMLCKELTGIIPWMANINKVSDEVCLFSHCTIAPGLVSGYSVMTHFETGKGTAIQGEFTSELVTIFRLDKNLRKAFIATAGITGRPKSNSACRTQIAVKLTAKEVASLRQNPLGNHHLIFPGDCKRLLQLACLYLEIEDITR